MKAKLNTTAQSAGELFTKGTDNTNKYKIYHNRFLTSKFTSITHKFTYSMINHAKSLLVLLKTSEVDEIEIPGKCTLSVDDGEYKVTLDQQYAEDLKKVDKVKITTATGLNKTIDENDKIDSLLCYTLMLATSDFADQLSKNIKKFGVDGQWTQTKNSLLSKRDSKNTPRL